MSIKYNDKTHGQEILLAGISSVDQILNGSSKNAISNKAVYNALAEKIEKTVNDLIYYYDTSQTYSKTEVRQLIGAINTLTIEVVSSLPVSDISTTTIYFLANQGGTYDEYVYVNNTWVKIGDTDIDLSGYLTTANFQIAIADYYNKAEIDAMIANYYTKTQVDAMVDAKQDELTFDNAPTAGSDNPVKSGGIKTALDAKQNTLTFDSTPTANSSNPVTSNGIKTAIDARIFSNPNLLDNPFFSVNSRGKSVYAGEGIVSTYCVDRWSLYNWWSSSSTTACVLNSDGTITLNNNTESSNRQFVQFVPFEYLRVGESYTASIDVVSITGSASFNMQQDTSPWTGVAFVSSITSPGIKTGTKNWVEVTDTKVRLFISLAANTSITIRAMKLEKGSISTLNLDTVPNYATELAKCRASKADSTDTFANQGSYFLSADNGILGAKNLLQNDAETKTINGITFTVNSDGSITANGTATGTQLFEIVNPITFAAGSYKLSDGGVSSSDIKLQVVTLDGQTLIAEGTQSFIFNATTSVKVRIYFLSGAVANNLTFKPMIRLASDTDATYQPYAMTNRELTEKTVKQTNMVQCIIKMTSNVLPTWETGLSVQDATDIAKQFYDLFKRLGGETGTGYTCILQLQYVKASDGTNLGSSSGFARIYSAVTYSQMISNNSTARFRLTYEPYGYAESQSFGLWGTLLSYAFYGRRTTTSIDIKGSQNHNTISG